MMRNKILCLVASVSLLLVLGTTGSLAAAENNTTCKANTTSCNGTCVDTSMDLRNCGSCGNLCPPGQHCVGGKCVCPMNLTYCGGVCIDTSTDELHCGACGQACPAGTVCIGGGCWPSGSYGGAEPETEPAANPNWPASTSESQPATTGWPKS